MSGTKYYWITLPPLFIIILTLYIVGANPLSIAGVTMSYSWRTIMEFPDIKMRILSRKYRLSFLKAIYIYEINLFALLDRLNIKKQISKILSPTLVAGLLSIIFQSTLFIWVLAGALIFEVNLIIYKHILYLSSEH